MQSKIFEGIKSGLELTIKYLIDLHLYFGNEFIEYKISKCGSETIKQPDTIRVQDGYNCPDHRYKVRIISRSPLIIYLEKFLTEDEMKHLIELAEPRFQPSKTRSDGKRILNEHRTSSTAKLQPHGTPIVKCIEQRFAEFQGNVDIEYLEPLQVVKYVETQEYKPHFDAFTDPNEINDIGQRITTFFTYLQSNCSQAATEFIYIKFNETLHERFCDILICDENSSEHGIRFRPLSGNSVFWFNVDEDGEVDPFTVHAGLPPIKDGYKIGLNAWTFNKTFHVKLENNKDESVKKSL
ncbi:unnamed protein product [Adineta steineri]|uniref:Prolyl 4-hydroxylase alpha subunit domain-containing protein n=1 Tax=Adineta steineri TaxID=433720 RepID=A0A815UJU1_9BILA|nr:unnamed protein product [Adineta steineri]CAF4138389.1 unnamed protein product [Adineta steineri]